MTAPTTATEIEDFLVTALETVLGEDWTLALAASAIMRAMRRDGLCLAPGDTPISFEARDDDE